MWYQSARLITVQIALLLGCFCSVAVATIGYVAAMLLVKIEEEVGGRVKFQGHREVCPVEHRSAGLQKLADLFFWNCWWKTTSWHVVARWRWRWRARSQAVSVSNLSEIGTVDRKGRIDLIPVVSVRTCLESGSVGKFFLKRDQIRLIGCST